MPRETIKSFVYQAYKEGLDANETWRAMQSAFPHRLVSWGYVTRLRKMFSEGEQVAKAFADLISKSRRT